MNDHLITAVVSILTAVVGLAIIATLVSKNANTSNVLNSFFSGYGGLISAAEAPVTSGGVGSLSFSNIGNGNLNY